MRSYLDFEKPVAELEAKVEELRAMAETGNAVAVGDEIKRLEVKAVLALRELYADLTPWQKTQVARHPQRPHCLDTIAGLLTEFVAAGRRPQIRRGRGHRRRLRPLPRRGVCVIGHEKGSDTESRLKHNFGMARPEGYRKAVRLMTMADRFGIPVITLVDTAGAYPGIGAEERGQAEAIARSTDACLSIGVPNIAVILGEGGSGGAIALATANRVLMLEHAIYSVDFAGRRRLDPLARHHQGAGSGDQHEDHRPGYGEVRHDRRHRSGAGRRGASRSGRGDCRHRRGDRQGARRIAPARRRRRARAAARKIPAKWGGRRAEIRARRTHLPLLHHRLSSHPGKP